VLRHYFQMAIRGFARHKLYSLINIVGLAVGLTCIIFVILFVRDEFRMTVGFRTAKISTGSSSRSIYPAVRPCRWRSFRTRCPPPCAIRSRE
jgi:hypothetical protein